jgi:uncharacterized protein (DUF983 family)
LFVFTGVGQPSPSTFKIKEFLEERGVGFKAAGGGSELLLDSCPICGKRKMYVKVENGTYFCHVCVPDGQEHGKGGPARLIHLLLDIPMREAIELVQGAQRQFVTYDEDLVLLDESETEAPRGPTIIPRPTYFEDLDRRAHPEVWAYLSSRGISDEAIGQMPCFVSQFRAYSDGIAHVAKLFRFSRAQLAAYKGFINRIFDEKVPTNETLVAFLQSEWGFPSTLAEETYQVLLANRFKNRAIFPVIVRGALYGWVARDITGQARQKVLNSTGDFRRQSVWNHDNVRGSEEIVICEGVVSALKCGVHRAIATLGKYVSPDQIMAIKALRPKRVYICLDVDAVETAKALYFQVAGLFPEVYVVRLPPVLSIRCPECGKKMRFDEHGERSASCANGHKFVGEALESLAEKSDYLDAGDYTEAEMEAFIRESEGLGVDPDSVELAI